MKSGLVINTFILKAFQKFSGNPNSLIPIFTGDGEIGSPASKDEMIAEVKMPTVPLTVSPSGRMKKLSMIEKVVYSVILR